MPRYGSDMKLSLPVLALVMATGLPLAACAQQSNAAENGPSPEIQAQMQQARDTAKTAAFNDLTPANRAKVQSIIDQVNNGQLTDLRAASQQIDAALSPAESKAVLGERDKMMTTLRPIMPARDNMPARTEAGPNAGPGPNGAPPNGPRGGIGGRGGNDPGRFLLSLGVSREKMRALRQQQQQSQPKPQ
jgi:hypothetical protein